MRKVLVNTARAILAITLILSGFVKAVDPLGTQYKIIDYLEVLHVGQYIPDFMTLGASILLSAVEFGLGVCLLLAIRRRLVSKLVVLMMLIMTPLTLWLALTNPVSDCGCFGDALILTNWQTFFKNVILLALALLVWRWPLMMLRFVSRANQSIIISYTALFILIVSGWSLYDLPYFDFRPYHVGTDLRKGWEQMMEGEESPYAEFFIESVTDGEDITDSLLHQKGYLFLLVSPHLELADDSQLDLINQMHEYAEYNGYPFYCLTASNEKGIRQWQDLTGAEYPFCQTDEITLKTIIRSNPGLVLLKDGKIIRKWSHNRLPDEYALSERLEKAEIGQMSTNSVPRKILIILLWYVLPLALIVLADRLWAWSRWMYRNDKKRKKETEETLYNPINLNNNEKENCSRQLENEPEPARGHCPGQGTE